MNHTLPPNTPILVGYSVIQQKENKLSQAKEAYQLMADAVKNAARHANNAQLITDCDRLYVPEGMWSYKDPARLVAQEIGADQAHSVFAKIGITQQTLMAEACQRIQQGDDDIVIVAGGEAKYRQLQATIQGEQLKETTQADDTVANTVLEPDAELWLIEETTVGLGMPVGYYAVMESAYRASKGLSVDQHRDDLASLYHDFSKVAAANPHAWKREEIPCDVIRNASSKNKMLAFPYTKLHNTSWNVDQACAMIFTSVEKAQALGIDPSLWIYPWVSTENNAMLAVAQRPDLHRSVGAEFAASAALEHCSIRGSDIDIIDLYSCFPVAVEMYADAFKLSPDQARTCTGGMAFAGGPLNNYALQAACRAFELLDLANDESVALTSSVSGLITKQGFGLWSKQPPQQSFRFIDVSDQVRVSEQGLTVIGAYYGKANIVGYTIIYDNNEATRAIAICDLEDGVRTVCYSEDSELMSVMLTEEFVGKDVMVDDRIFTMA